jgi:hypothetical protein
MAQVLKNGSRKFDLSDNWDVHHPNGNHMYTTSKRKVDWYLVRELAKVIAPNKIQFTFVPKGEGFQAHEIFGKLPRINRCVVCGEEHNLQRHHVVPYHYRKFMPLIYKSRNHHDVVLICRKHHEEYEQIAKFYKNEIATKFDVDSIEEMNAKQIAYMVGNLKDEFKAIKLLDTLLNRYNVIPEERVLWIAKELKEVMNIDVLQMDFDQIEVLHAKTDKSILAKKLELMNVENFYHGKAVIAKLNSEEEFNEFIRGWRVHFVESMKPEFMPIGWDIFWKCSIYDNNETTNIKSIHNKSKSNS